MSQPDLLTKIAAVASSVLLAGGGVAYYAGAFNGLIGPSVQPAESRTISSSKSKVLGVSPAPSSSDGQDSAETQQAPPKTRERDRTIMTGSKSEMPIALFLKDIEEITQGGRHYDETFESLRFRSLDRNGDGCLTREELKGTMFADHFDEIDTNGDGKIDKEEFEAYWKKQTGEKRD